MAAKARIEETSYDNWNGGRYGFTLTLEIPAALYAQIRENTKALETAIEEYAQEFLRGADNHYLQSVVISPEVAGSDDWRDKAKAWLAGQGVTNQGRVRSDNIATRSHDGLLFRSQPEINLYKALKSIGVSFAPLPVFIRGGKEYRRIEPDFVVIKDGIVLAVEVDGDTVHTETPVEAHSRTTMLMHEGVYVERVSASDCKNEETAAACAKRLVAVIERHRASR